MKTVVEKARELMRKQTEKNKSPAWLLTELAIEKGRELAKKHDVNEDLVTISLYLVHTVFDRKIGESTQKSHPQLSSEFVRKYLEDWNVDDEDKEIILNGIEAHHNKVHTKSLTAEVVKNAECFKFVTLKGSLITLHEMGIRGMPFGDAVEFVFMKMNQKRNLLTLEDCIKEADENCKEIEEIFGSVNRKELSSVFHGPEGS